MLKGRQGQRRIVMAIGLAVLLAVPRARAIEPPPEAPDAASPGKDTTAPRVDEILTKLERRSDGLKDIRCKVRFVEDDRINLSQRTKQGSILFMITDPNPNFLIHFERTEVDGVLGKQEWYLFDGHWLYEVLERIRQVTKREIVEPGEQIDLFDLERAPFPLPFGQRRETILRNFDVTLVAPEPKDPARTDHLVCIPKPDSAMADRYDRLEFFVLQDLHLPSRIVAVKNGGLEINTADFPDLSDKSINAGVNKRAFVTQSAWRGYKEVVERLE
jgi:hypothetical protein